MTGAQHTPGPWFRNVSARYPIFAGPRGYHVKIAGMIIGQGVSAEEAEKNLILITAAPTLVEALKGLIVSARPSNWDDDEDPACAAAWRAADAALAAALGEPDPQPSTHSEAA